jgi:PAS domain S-box-containing protein
VLNDELRRVNLEVSLLSDIVASIDIPIVIVDRDLRIRRLNPRAESVLRITAADLGKPITEAVALPDFAGIEGLTREAIASGEPREKEVQDQEGRWQAFHAQPHRAADQSIQGAVITLIDITRAKTEANEARGYADAIVETVQEAVLVLDAGLRVKSADRTFVEAFRLPAEKIIGFPIQEIGEGQWNDPDLVAYLRENPSHQTDVKDFQIEREFPGIGLRVLKVSVYRLKQAEREAVTVMAINDITERQMALRALEEQSRLIDLAHDAIIVRDADSAITLWNPGAEALYGWTKEEATGKITHDLLQTKFPVSREELDEKLNTKGDWSGELVHTSRDGGQLIVASRQVAMKNAAGETTAILEINRDFTQPKQIEASLRASEARLRALITSMDDVVFEVDPHGLCLGAWTNNSQFLPFLKHEAPPYSIEDLLPTQSYRPLQNALQRVLATNQPETVDYTLKLYGMTRWFVARINRITAPGRTADMLSVLVSDVTPRKEIELALKESEEKFRMLVEGVKDYAIYAIDPEGYVVSWNSGAERIKGYRRQEIIGKHFSIFYLPEEVAAGKPERDLEIAAAEGRYEDPVGRRVRKDGTQFFANLVISATRDEDGRLRGFTKVTRDITDQKRAEDSIRQLSGHILRLQDDERRRIARDLHDSMAQILTALSMNLSLVRKQPSVAKDAKADRLIEESEALAYQASEEVRSTSRLLHPPDLDTLGLLAAIRWYAGRFSERSGIAVKLSLPDDLCRLPDDHEIALFRVTQESLANVQRHSGSKTVRIRIEQSDDEVRLEVEDKGRGIPDGVLGMEAQSVHHLGVGIAGMRERLAQLGGRLELTSGAKGTKVKAVLPCPAAEAQTAAEQKLSSKG